MKIRYQSVYALELIGRIYEYVRVALMLGNIPVKRGYALKSAAGGRSDGNDSAAVFLCLVYEVSRLFGEIVVFAVHLVVEDVVLLDGAERADADMQRDIRRFDAFRFDLRKAF